MASTNNYLNYSNTKFTRPIEKEPKIIKYGIQDPHVNQSKLDAQIEEIIRNGFTVLENRVSSENIEIMRRRIDEIFTEQIEKIGGIDKLESIKDEDSAKFLLSYDPVFLDLVTDAEALPLVEHFLGENYILMLQNAVINRPNSQGPAEVWHRDLFAQRFTSSVPLSISVLVVVDDFTLETGGTLVLPGSHRIPEFPSDEFARRYQHQISTKAGSIIVLDSMLFHCTGTNFSNIVRRSISQIFTLPNIKQQISMPKILKGKYSDDPKLKMILGYGAETGDTIIDWRQIRLNRRHEDRPKHLIHGE